MDILIDLYFTDFDKTEKTIQIDKDSNELAFMYRTYKFSGKIPDYRKDAYIRFTCNDKRLYKKKDLSEKIARYVAENITKDLNSCAEVQIIPSHSDENGFAFKAFYDKGNDVAQDQTIQDIKSKIATILTFSIAQQLRIKADFEQSDFEV